MADNDDSKTEEASEKKLREALEKGNTPVSREAGTFASIIGILVVMGFLVREGAMRFSATLVRLVDDPAGWSLNSSTDAGALVGAVAVEAFTFLLPVLATLALFGVIASVAETLASRGTWMGAPKGHLVMGMSNDSSFLRPLTDGHLHACASPVHQGRTRWQWRVECRDDAGRLCSVSTVNIAVRPFPAT